MKLLLIDNIHHAFIENLQGKKIALTDGRRWDEETIAQRIADFDGIVIKSRMAVTRQLIDSAPRLQVIVRNGVGTEHIDMAYCEQMGIEVLTAPEGSRDAVGEHALAMLLSLLTNLTRAHMQVREGKWNREPNRGHELKGKTVAIIGYGNMGSAMAEKLAGFGVNVLAYDKYKKDFGTAHVKEVSMPEIFEQADVLSLHVPLTKETTHMVNDAYLARFAKPIILINTARGMVVNTQHLVDAMQADKVTGVCLDVLEYESTSFENAIDTSALPAPLQYLLQSDHAVLSPHIAGWTYESDRKIAEALAAKLLAIFSK